MVEWLPWPFKSKIVLQGSQIFLCFYPCNKNGIDDNGERGIAGVKVALWGDNNKDGVPDGDSFKGYTITDSEGYYRFTVSPGSYTVFVWLVDNWEEGGPL